MDFLANEERVNEKAMDVWSWVVSSDETISIKPDTETQEFIDQYAFRDQIEDHIKSQGKTWPRLWKVYCKMEQANTRSRK